MKTPDRADKRAFSCWQCGREYGSEAERGNCRMGPSDVEYLDDSEINDEDLVRYCKGVI